METISNSPFRYARSSHRPDGSRSHTALPTLAQPGSRLLVHMSFPSAGLPQSCGHVTWLSHRSEGKIRMSEDEEGDGNGEGEDGDEDENEDDDEVDDEREAEDDGDDYDDSEEEEEEYFDSTEELRLFLVP
jgi:hypothetical protein